MIRSILNKWTIGTLSLLIIIAASCYIYLQHEKEKYMQLVDESIKLRQQHQSDRTPAVSQETPAEIIDQAQRLHPSEQPKQIIGKTININTPHPAKNAIISTPEMDNTEEVRMSPHGFGAYPQVPKGAPIGTFDCSDDIEMELLGRVMVKAWNAGKRFEGGSFEDGKVYLHYPDTIYVEWKTEKDPLTDETIELVAGTLSSHDHNLTHEQIENMDIPTHINILDFNNQGIDPYTYLDLPLSK